MAEDTWLVARTESDATLLQTGFQANPPSAQLERTTGHDDDDMTGLVAMDSSLQGQHRKGGATDWSIVACADDGSPKVWLNGRSPEELPVQAKILRCELWVLHQTLLHVVPPTKSLTNNATVQKDVCRGQDWCTAAIRPLADLWKKIWAKLDDVGGVGTPFTSSKVKAIRPRRRWTPWKATSWRCSMQTTLRTMRRSKEWGCAAPKWSEERS